MNKGDIFWRNRTNWTCMLFLPMYTFIISIYSDSLFHSCLRCLIAGKEISCSTAVLARSSPNGGDTSRIAMNLISWTMCCWSRKNISTSNFQMSLNALICMESYYFHVYGVSCDVHFRYSDDAFLMWTAYHFPKISKWSSAMTQTNKPSRPAALRDTQRQSRDLLKFI